MDLPATGACGEPHRQPPVLIPGVQAVPIVTTPVVTEGLQARTLGSSDPHDPGPSSAITVDVMMVEGDNPASSEARATNPSKLSAAVAGVRALSQPQAQFPPPALDVNSLASATAATAASESTAASSISHETPIRQHEQQHKQPLQKKPAKEHAIKETASFSSSGSGGGGGGSRNTAAVAANGNRPVKPNGTIASTTADSVAVDKTRLAPLTPVPKAKAGMFSAGTGAGDGGASAFSSPPSSGKPKIQGKGKAKTKGPAKSASKQGKKQGKNKKKSAQPVLIPGWEAIEGKGACNVCFDDQSYELNPMMQCASCSVTVHQHCYGCRDPPEEGRAWLCDPCSQGENTAMLRCTLCSETGVRGGAMKFVTPGVSRTREWAHACCTMWIPEVCVGSEELEPVHVEGVPNDRKTLKCVLCGTKGACVQCAGGRCLVAYHPWCLLHTDKRAGILYRSLDPKGNLHVYCPKHTQDIKVPLDLPDKATPLGPRNYMEAHERISRKLMVLLPLAPGSGGKAKTGRGPTKQGGAKSKGSSKRARDTGEMGVGIVGSDGALPLMAPHSPPPGRKRRKKFGASPAAKKSDEEELPSVERESALMDNQEDKDVDAEGNLVLHTFWDKAGAPRMGQDNSVTSDRFWEVMSARFPEDHKDGWMRRLIELEHIPKEDDPIFVMPDPKKSDKLIEKTPAKTKEAKLDDGRLSDGGSSSGDDVMEVDIDDDDDEDFARPRNGKGKAPVRGVRGSARLGGGSGSIGGGSDTPLPDPAVFDEELKAVSCHHQAGLLLQKGKLQAGCRFAFRTVRNREDFRSLRAAEKETGLEFVKYERPWPDGFRQSPHSFPFPGVCKAPGPVGAADGGAAEKDSGAGDDFDTYVALQGWTAHDVNDTGVRLRRHRPRHAEVMATAKAKAAAGEGAIVDVDVQQVPETETESWPLPELKDDVTELLGSMQEKLKEITSSSRRTVESIIARSKPSIAAAAEFRRQNDRIFKRYGRVQVWKKLYHKLEFGMADRPQNFNKTNAADLLAVPASWSLIAEGRKTKEEHEAWTKANVEAANKEDAVCMVCFDGTTDEEQLLSIVYCDGCGMSVHQSCYGVQDVEADFFCERCTELRRLEEANGWAEPEAVRCAVCPVIHGAFKRAGDDKDKKWVHMPCLLTIPGGRMDDLINKTKVDVSEVHIDPHIPPPLLQFPVDAPQVQQHPAACASACCARDTKISSSTTSGGNETAVAAPGGGEEGSSSPWQALLAAHAQQTAGGPAFVSTQQQQQQVDAGSNNAATDSAEEGIVDVSAPASTSLRANVANAGAAAAAALPRRAPERELACCFCHGREGSLLDCGITECGVGGGGVLRHGEGPALCGPGGADGNLGDGVAVCGRRFHFLCAWFAGAYIKLGATDPSYTRGERGLTGDASSWPEPGQPRFGFPTGMCVEARCLQHSVGAPGRKGAPPEIARVVTLKGAGGGSLMSDTFVEGTTAEEQSKLRSKYRMQGHPDWQLDSKKKKSKSQLNKERKKAERAKQSTMRLSKPRALDPDKYDRYSCAVCLQIRQPLLGGHSAEEGDVAAEAAAAASAAAADPSVVECSACRVRVHRKCYGVPEGVGAPGAAMGDRWFCVPCSSQASEPTCTLCPRKGGAFVRIRAAHYCHAFCAERTPGARLVDPVGADVSEVVSPAVKDEARVGSSASASAGAGAGAGGAAKGKGKAAMAVSVEVDPYIKKDQDVTDVSSGDGGGGGGGGGAAGVKRPAKKALGGKVPRGNGPAPGSGAAKAAASFAKTADTKGIPKELKKPNGKCHICNRKGGVLVPCAYARTPCERWLHPMCAAQKGRHSRRLSPDEAKASRYGGAYAVVCEDHVARCLRQISSYHWVDFLSLYRMRADLDRARVLFDCVLRREKIKRQLHRTSSELFDSCLAHFRASAKAGAAALRERLDNIDAVAAAANAVVANANANAAAAAGTEGTESRRSTTFRAREEAKAAAAAAAAVAEAAKAAAAAKAVNKAPSSKKGTEAKIAATIANVPWYGKYSMIEDNALALPENPEPAIRLKLPRGGGDLGSSEFGRVRKKTLKAEEATSVVGTDARRVFSASDPDSATAISSVSAGAAAAAAAKAAAVARVAVAAAASSASASANTASTGAFPSAASSAPGGRRPQYGMPGPGDKRKFSAAAAGGSGAPGGATTAGAGERWPAISAAPAKRRKALWPLGKRPPAGREGSHARSRAAAERLVDACIGNAPLEGIAEAVLTKRNSNVPEHFGEVMERLLGKRNVSVLMEARKKHLRANPRPPSPPLSSPQRVLIDRQLKELCDTICEERVEREDGEPRWESGKLKPDDGKRDLGELFDEAPSKEAYPEYHDKVTNIMDLKTIRGKVLERLYTGIDALVDDVAVMYSNAQVIEHAQATKDGKRLLELARKVANRLKEEREGVTHAEKLARQRDENSSSAREEQRAGDVSLVGISCAKCDRRRVHPENKSLDPRKESHWFCDPCIAASPDIFTGHRIGVFWDGLGKWLTATIRRYEPLSGKHEVLYTIDGHWEFLRLGDPRNRIRYHHPVPPPTLKPPPSPRKERPDASSREQGRGKVFDPGSPSDQHDEGGHLRGVAEKGAGDGGAVVSVPDAVSAPALGNKDSTPPLSRSGDRGDEGGSTGPEHAREVAPELKLAKGATAFAAEGSGLPNSVEAGREPEKIPAASAQNTSLADEGKTPLGHQEASENYGKGSNTDAGGAEEAPTPVLEPMDVDAPAESADAGRAGGVNESGRGSDAHGALAAAVVAVRVGESGRSSSNHGHDASGTSGDVVPPTPATVAADDVSEADAGPASTPERSAPTPKNSDSPAVSNTAPIAAADSPSLVGEESKARAASARVEDASVATVLSPPMLLEPGRGADVVGSPKEPGPPTPPAKAAVDERLSVDGHSRDPPAARGEDQGVGAAPKASAPQTGALASASGDEPAVERVVHRAGELGTEAPAKLDRGSGLEGNAGIVNDGIRDREGKGRGMKRPAPEDARSTAGVNGISGSDDDDGEVLERPRKFPRL